MLIVLVFLLWLLTQYWWLLDPVTGNFVLFCDPVLKINKLAMDHIAHLGNNIIIFIESFTNNVVEYMLLQKGFHIFFLRYSYVKHIGTFVTEWVYGHITFGFEKKISKQYFYVFLCKNSTPSSNVPTWIMSWTNLNLHYLECFLISKWSTAFLANWSLRRNFLKDFSLYMYIPM